MPGGKAGPAGPGRRRKPLYLLHSGERRKCNEIGSWGSWTLLESSALILKEKFEQRSVLAKYMAGPSSAFLTGVVLNGESGVGPYGGASEERRTREFRKEIEGLASLATGHVGRNVGRFVGRFLTLSLTA